MNYLAHFLLTYRLLPLLEASAPARIVNVSSMGQAPIDFADVMMERSYNPGDAYRRSKLAQIMFTIDLAAELDAANVTVNSLHPARSMNTARVINGGFQPLSTVEEGAEATMQLAVSPELAGRSGLYFNGLNEAQANAQAYDTAARAQLRALSFDADGSRPQELSDSSASARERATERYSAGERTSGMRPACFHELPAELGGLGLDGFVVAQVTRREAVDAPLRELHDVLELVRPELRILERRAALLEHDDVVERHAGHVAEADDVLRQRQLARRLSRQRTRSRIGSGT